MQCSRCQGLMVVNRMQESSSSDAVVGWRCLLCGESIDPGIEANRGVLSRRPGPGLVFLDLRRTDQRRDQAECDENKEKTENDERERPFP